MPRVAPDTTPNNSIDSVMSRKAHSKARARAALTTHTLPRQPLPLLMLLVTALVSDYLRTSDALNIPTPLRNVAAAFPGASGLVTAPPPVTAAIENGDNDEYPWKFTGRLWFRPALVRVPPPSKSPDANGRSGSSAASATYIPTPPPSVSIVQLFGWTVGGVVALEYDDSPVGPYREYVTMGAVVTKRGALGQWGSRLYVSTDVGKDVCEEVWGVPAYRADIDFYAHGDGGDDQGAARLHVQSAPDGSSMDRQRISVGGWDESRVSGVVSAGDYGAESPKYPPFGLPVLWTPTIKALWAPLVLFPPSRRNGDADADANADADADDGGLPLHRLRLSASAVRLRWCGQPRCDLLGVPLGIGLVVDNVLIEISRRDGSL